MYAKNRLVEVRKVFDQIQEKGMELWNAMIATYVGNGYAYDAMEAYNWMRLSGIPSDSFTISNILSTCSMIESGDSGRVIHKELIKRPIQSNVAAQRGLLTMYAKFGSTKDACSVFKTMTERYVVAWDSMISGFCQNKKFKEALDLFRTKEADGVLLDYDIMASAIMGLEDTELGGGIHGFVIKSGLHSDAFVATSLIDMYSKCGLPEMAGNVFSTNEKFGMEVTMLEHMHVWVMLAKNYKTQRVQTGHALTDSNGVIERGVDILEALRQLTQAPSWSWWIVMKASFFKSSQEKV